MSSIEHSSINTRRKNSEIDTPKFLKNDLQFITVSDLFDDFWLPMAFWIDVSGIKQIKINVYIPRGIEYENNKIAVILVGTRLQIVSISRGEINKISILPIDTLNSRIGFELSSAEVVPNRDERKLGVKLISIEFDDEIILPENFYYLKHDRIYSNMDVINSD